MKEIGKVIEYNGNYGVIVNQDGKRYILLDKDIMDDNIIQPNDDVSYVPEKYTDEEIDENLARFVKKISRS